MPDVTPIAVSAGFGWTAAGAWLGGVSAFVGLVALIIRQIGPWRKQTTEAETRLRERLEARVAKLEEKLELKEALHNAQRALDRHRINNSNACLDALLLLLEQDPTKAAAAVQRIKEMRARQLEAEALEKAAIHAAEITAKATGDFEMEAAE